MFRFITKPLQKILFKCCDSNSVNKNMAALAIDQLLIDAKKDRYTCVDMHLRCEYEMSLYVAQRFFFHLDTVESTIHAAINPENSFKTENIIVKKRLAVLLEIETAKNDLCSIEKIKLISTSKLHQRLLAVNESVETYANAAGSVLYNTEFNIFIRNVTTAVNICLFYLVATILVVTVAFGLSYKTLIIPAISEYQKQKNSRRIFDLMDKHLQPDIVSENLGPIEKDNGGKRFRWALEGQFDLSFYTESTITYTLDFEFFSHIIHQKVSIIINNGEEKKIYIVQDNKSWLETNTKDSIAFESHPGVNSIVFVFSDYNHFQTTFESSDGRHLAAAFTKLKLYPATSVHN